VYSTPADMARVLQHFLGIPGAGGPAAPVAPAFIAWAKPALLRSVQGLSLAGDPTGIGPGWVQLGDPDSASAVVQKTGGGAGFAAYIALNLKCHTGIFLAATEGRRGLRMDFREANNLLAALANVPPLPPKIQPVPAIRKRRPLPRKSVLMTAPR
jgi:serine-type D-Ala-D-Ala carboxypeptidase/endopeptidase